MRILYDRVFRIYRDGAEVPQLIDCQTGDRLVCDDNINCEVSKLG